jgi:hypothetical protein
MPKPNRDLLVLLKQELMTPQAMELAVERLHEMLHHFEQSPRIYLAYELIDVNKYKITNKYFVLNNFFRNKKQKAFVFLNCKN